jgi:hypothetical protein
MPAQPKERQTSLIDKHVARAKDLDVSLLEYSEAYDVDLDDLQAAAKGEAKTNDDKFPDFVAVKLESMSPPSNEPIFTIAHAAGHTINFHQWPPREVLDSLWKCSS